MELIRFTLTVLKIDMALPKELSTHDSELELNIGFQLFIHLLRHCSEANYISQL